jgi:NAD+ synthase
MKKLDYSKVESYIVSWLKDYAVSAKKEAYIIGVSGGIDSATASTVCLKTGLKLICVQMPIHQHKSHVERAILHINWLKENFPENVSEINCDLTHVFDTFVKDVEIHHNDKELLSLTEANSRARLRMTTLYYYAGLFNCLVLGTGNKVEDYGCGYFSKFGDGGVDVSPIGDLMKSEVKNLARHMGVKEELINAIPSDGLYEQELSDEQNIGATYDELEFAMKYIESNPRHFSYSPEDLNLLSKRQQEVLSIYKSRHFANQHKMQMPPICSVEHLRK